MKTMRSKNHLTRNGGILVLLFGAMFAAQVQAAPADENPVVVNSSFIAGGEGGSATGNESEVGYFVPQDDEC